MATAHTYRVYPVEEHIPGCDCLAKWADVPHAYGCGAAAAGDVDDSDIRCLAELAAWKDVDVAVSVYRRYAPRWDAMVRA